MIGFEAPPSDVFQFASSGYAAYEEHMKTLTITEARKNLGFWLKAAARGEEVSIISGADIIGLRRVRVTAVDAEPRPVPASGVNHHPAIGMWKDRKIDGVTYQRKLRREWDRS